MSKFIIALYLCHCKRVKLEAFSTKARSVDRLNGTSSSGKTALAKALQKLDGSYEKLNIDDDCEIPIINATIEYVKQKTGVVATIDNIDEVWRQLLYEIP